MIEFGDQHVLAAAHLDLGQGAAALAQQALQHRHADRFGRHAFAGREGVAATLHPLRPGGKALARGQAIAARRTCGGFVRIARPGDGLGLFDAKQQHIVVAATHHRDRQHADDPIGIGRCTRDIADHRIAGKDRVALARRKPGGDRGTIDFVGRDPGQQHRRPVRHCEAIAGNRIDDQLVQSLGVGQHLAVMVHFGDQQLAQRIGACFVVDGRAAQAAFEHHREHFPEQLGCRPVGKARQARGVVVAGKQSPQFAVDDDGDRQRRGDVHVAQILDMHRGYRSQHRQRLVQRSPMALGCQDGDRHRCHVGDDAKGAAQVKLARLRRNIRCRIVQPEVAVAAATQRFGNHRAIVVAVEAIDHDAVEPGQRLDMAGAVAKELRQAVAVLQPGDHGACQARGLALVGCRGFGFDDDRIAATVDGDIERCLALDQGQGEDALHGIHALQRRRQVAQRVQRIGGDQLVCRLPQPFPGRRAGKFSDVCRDMGYRPICGQRQQEAIGLDIARDMDRLVIAVEPRGVLGADGPGRGVCGDHSHRRPVEPLDRHIPGICRREARKGQTGRSRPDIRRRRRCSQTLTGSDATCTRRLC